jgi:hypothetical protein
VGRSAPGQQRCQRSPLDEFHREIRPAISERTQLVDRHDAGILELPADLCFFDKSPDQFRLVLVAFEQDLHGQVAAQVRVAPLEHGSHPATSDLTEELVAVTALGGCRYLVG